MTARHRLAVLAATVTATTLACTPPPEPPNPPSPPPATVTITAPQPAPADGASCIPPPTQDYTPGPVVTCTVTVVLRSQGRSNCATLLDGPQHFHLVGTPITQMLQAAGNQDNRELRMRVTGRIGLPTPSGCEQHSRIFIADAAQPAAS